MSAAVATDLMFLESSVLRGQTAPASESFWAGLGQAGRFVRSVVNKPLGPGADVFASYLVGIWGDFVINLRAGPFAVEECPPWDTTEPLPGQRPEVRLRRELQSQGSPAPLPSETRKESRSRKQNAPFFPKEELSLQQRRTLEVGAGNQPGRPLGG